MFYKDKIILIEKSNQGLYLFRKVKNEIIMYSFLTESGNVTQRIILDDSYGEFDVELNNQSINIIYKNTKQDLILLDLENKRVLNVAKGLREVTYELNMINIEKTNNILFIEKGQGENLTYYLKHILIEDKNNIETYIVDKIKTYNFISPLKVIKSKNNILAAYYYLNQICIKEFDTETRSWSASTTLTDNQNKLYLDIIRGDKNLHLVYSDFTDENFKIKYKKYLINAGNIMIETEQDITDYGNNVDPILVYHLGKLWIIWRGTNMLFSRYSTDNGNSFSDIISWNESKTAQMVKYKYKTDLNDSDNIIDYPFGSFYPELKFIGFN